MLNSFWGKECRLFRRLVSPNPDEHGNEILKELIDNNIVREKILSILLCAISAVVLCLNIFTVSSSDNNSQIYNYFIYNYIVLFVVSSLFFVLTTVGKKTFLHKAPARVLHIALNILVLSSCSFNAVLNEIVGQQPFSFVIAMFCIASVVYFVPLERCLVYTLSYVIYVVGLIIVHNSILHVISSLIFSSILMALALIVSNINYSSYVKNFINKKTILNKNMELDRLYKLTKESLESRNLELMKTLEYEKTRTDFFANISHELKTPLTVIFSAEQMMDYIINNSSDTSIKQDMGQYMKIIKQNCYRLIRLISNLIDITKMDAGYFNINLKNCDIVNVVEDITLSVAKYMEDRNINLTFDTELEEKVVACDPDKIERIMLNLLSNAIKFTPTGGDIFVSICEKDDKISISVKDTGIGIPEDMQKHIFDRFIQVEGNMQKDKQGSGIGLSLVKSLVEMHGGSISIISREGSGSEFIIELPEQTVDDKNTVDNLNLTNENGNIEKINIEFSDIYG